MRERRLKSLLASGTAKNAITLAGSGILASTLSALGGILVAKYIPPEVNGQFRMYTIPLLYLSILHMGTFDAIFKQVPPLRAKGELIALSVVTLSARKLNILVSIIVLMSFIAASVYWLLQGSYQHAAGWLTQAVAAVSMYYGGYVAALLRSMSMFGTVARLQVQVAIISFLAVVFAPFLGFYALCLRSSLPAILNVSSMYKSDPCRSLKKVSIGIPEILSQVKVGLPLCLWGTLYSSIWLATELSLLVKYADLATVGYFSLAVMIRESINIIPQSVHQVLTPKLLSSIAVDSEKSGAVNRAFNQALLTSLVTALVIILAYPIVEFLITNFIESYIGGIELVKMTMWFTLVHAVSLPLNALIARDHHWGYGFGISVGYAAFLSGTAILMMLTDPAYAVVLGSLIGRVVRVMVGYVQVMRKI